LYNPPVTIAIGPAQLSSPVNNALAIIDLDPHADPPKVLAIGPDPAGNHLEVIWLQLDDVELVIHAMRLRPTFFDLLPTGDDQQWVQALPMSFLYVLTRSYEQQLKHRPRPRRPQPAQ
jgi:hypothetical protein